MNPSVNDKKFEAKFRRTSQLCMNWADLKRINARPEWHPRSKNDCDTIKEEHDESPKEEDEPNDEGGRRQ